LNFGNTQVVVIGLFIKLSIGNLNSSIPSYIILASCPGTSARKANATTSYSLRR